MFKITSRELVKITPERAKNLMAKNTYVSQRGFRKNHIFTLRKAIENGDFHTGEIVIAANGDGTEKLINGQHQLAAVIQTGKPIHALLVKAECETSSDMARLFSQFDVNATRSIGDIVNAETHSLGKKWHSRTASLLASALHILVGKTSDSRSEKARRIREYGDVGDFVDQFISKETQHIWKAPVIAAMVVTYWKDKRDAEKFWDGVAFGEMLTKKDPRLKLRTYLSSVSTSGRTRAHASRKEIRAKVITAWNAWRLGKTTSLKFHADKPVPKVL